MELHQPENQQAQPDSALKIVVRLTALLGGIVLAAWVLAKVAGMATGLH
jgi:hypothetical protein